MEAMATMPVPVLAEGRAPPLEDGVRLASVEATMGAMATALAEAAQARLVWAGATRRAMAKPKLKNTRTTPQAKKIAIASAVVPIEAILVMMKKKKTNLALHPLSIEVLA